MADFDFNNILGGINVGGMLKSFTGFFLILGVVALLGIGIYFFLTKNKRISKKGLLRKISWWEEINGRLEPISMDEAEEIVLPGTNLRSFYIKAKNLWLPRFSRGVRKDLFYVTKTRNGELVNFVLKGIEKDMKEAGLEYDHTDMKWAYENVKEAIKRNYKDKATPWWKEYQGVISTAILLVVMTFCFVLIIFFMGSLMEKLGGLASSVGEYVKQCGPQQTSGLVQGG